MDPQSILLAAVVLALGSAAGYSIGRGIERSRRRKERAAARDDASRIVARARKEADTALKAAELQGKEEVHRLRESWRSEEARRRGEVGKAERRIGERADSLERKSDRLGEREARLDRARQALDGRKRELDRRSGELDSRARKAEAFERAAKREIERKMESLAGLSRDEARSLLMSGLEDEARAQAASTVRAIRAEAKRTGEREGRKILAQAIQRMAGDRTPEMTVSVVQLPSDEMKGRIIGREGRNIRAFEQATGIDVVVDDTPEAVILSGFNPVRREVARIALVELVEDGRIHPARIEDAVKKSEKSVAAAMLKAAEVALYELDIHDVHPKIVRALGHLRFRTSYGQNQLMHSKEVALLAAAMATEMGLDARIAKRAGLLHDVGKGMTHDQEGTHVELGYALCERYGEPNQVLNAIRAHHDEEPHRYAETFLVTAADAISGSRPGARREMFDNYVKRLEKIENTVLEYPGVERCFAIQAGREVRVMVEPERVSDEEMDALSEKIARRFEEELRYPGQIKIVAIRETRAVDFAR